MNDNKKQGNDEVVNVMGNGDPISKTSEDIRQSYPSPQDNVENGFSVSQLAGDPEEFKRGGSTPAQGDDQTADDEINDDASVDLTSESDKGKKRDDKINGV